MPKRALKKGANENLLSSEKRQKNVPNYQLMLKAKNESNKILGQVKTKLQELGHQDGATNRSAVLTKVIKTDPANSADVNEWVSIYSTLGNHDQDIAANIKAIENANVIGANNWAGVYNDWGVVYLKMGQHDQALVACSKATKLDPTNFLFFSNLGTALSSAGQYKEAINALNQAIKVDSNDAEYFCNLGLAFFKAGDVKKAIDACSKATKLDPTNAELFCHLGFMYFRLGEYELALYPLFKSICLSDKIDRMTFINSLIETDVSDSEKQKMIKDLIVPLNTALMERGIEVKQANMNSTDALVKYAELIKMEDKGVIEPLIDVYFKMATREALDKASLLAAKDCFTEKEKAEYHAQVSKFFAPIGQTSQEDVVDSKNHAQVSKFFATSTNYMTDFQIGQTSQKDIVDPMPQVFGAVQFPVAPEMRADIDDDFWDALL